MRGDSGVAGEGIVFGIPKFYSWGKCTILITNINSDWMFNAFSGLCIILCYLRGSFSWGVTSQCTAIIALFLGRPQKMK